MKGTTNMKNQQSVLIDEIQAAEMLSIDRRTLQKWRIEGLGPKFVRLSKKCVRYSLKDISKWIDDRTFGSTTEVRKDNNG